MTGNNQGINPEKGSEKVNFAKKEAKKEKCGFCGKIRFLNEDELCQKCEEEVEFEGDWVDEEIAAFQAEKKDKGKEKVKEQTEPIITEEVHENLVQVEALRDQMKKNIFFTRSSSVGNWTEEKKGPFVVFGDESKKQTPKQSPSSSSTSPAPISEEQKEQTSTELSKKETDEKLAKKLSEAISKEKLNQDLEEYKKRKLERAKKEWEARGFWENFLITQHNVAVTLRGVGDRERGEQFAIEAISDRIPQIVKEQTIELQQELNSERKDFERQNTALKELMDREVKERDDKISKLEADLKEARELEEQLKTDKETIKQELKRRQESLKKAADDLAKLPSKERVELDALRTKYAQTEETLENLRAKAKDYWEAIEQLKGERDEWEQRADSSKQMYLDQLDIATGLSVLKINLEGQVKSLENKIGSGERELENVKKAKEREIADWAKSLETVEKSEKELEKEKTELLKTISAKNAEIDEKTKEAKDWYEKYKSRRPGFIRETFELSSGWVAKKLGLDKYSAYFNYASYLLAFILLILAWNLFKKYVLKWKETNQLDEMRKTLGDEKEKVKGLKEEKKELKEENEELKKGLKELQEKENNSSPANDNETNST